jgi:hypothetical protein
VILDVGFLIEHAARKIASKDTVDDAPKVQLAKIDRSGVVSSLPLSQNDVASFGGHIIEGR